jgi:hypothetical protein
VVENEDPDGLPPERDETEVDHALDWAIVGVDVDEDCQTSGSRRVPAKTSLAGVSLPPWFRFSVLEEPGGYRLRSSGSTRCYSSSCLLTVALILISAACVVRPADGAKVASWGSEAMPHWMPTMSREPCDTNTLTLSARAPSPTSSHPETSPQPAHRG